MQWLVFSATLDPVQDNKKNTKRREVDNKQLKKVLSGVIEHVRIGHVLPPHSELLESVFRRGLADRGMPLDIGEGSFYPNFPWMRRREEKDFVRPRLFLPYLEEAKVRFIFFPLFQIEKIKKKNNNHNLILLYRGCIPHECE